jgi:hypothetical protein
MKHCQQQQLSNDIIWHLQKLHIPDKKKVLMMVVFLCHTKTVMNKQKSPAAHRGYLLAFSSLLPP